MEDPRVEESASLSVTPSTVGPVLKIHTVESSYDELTGEWVPEKYERLVVMNRKDAALLGVTLILESIKTTLFRIVTGS